MIVCDWGAIGQVSSEIMVDTVDFLRDFQEFLVSYKIFLQHVINCGRLENVIALSY